MKHFTLLFATLFLWAVAMAQPGTLDPSFNPGDAGFGLGDGANSFTYFSIPQASGQIYLGGNFTTYNGAAANRLARLNADGTLDATFNTATGAGAAPLGAAVQTDGKIVLGGEFTAYGGTPRNRIARANTNGTNDATFTPGTGANDRVFAVAIQSDGKIIIAGDFTDYNGTGRTRIARLNTDGTLDGTFNPGAGANGRIREAIIRPDGKILIAGAFTGYDGSGRNRIALLNDNGTLDFGFNPGAGADGEIFGMALQPDGKIVITGEFANYDGTGRVRIARLESSGNLDTGFNPGAGFNFTAYKPAVQADGKVVVGGAFTTFDGNTVNGIARLNANGSHDATYLTGAGATDILFHVALQTDGKAVLSGNFTALGTTQAIRAGRLNTNGTTDTVFNPGSGTNGGTIRAIAKQTDNKIISVGDFFGHNGSGANRIARLNYDGTFDAAYSTGGGAGGGIFALALQTDNKALIGGSFTAFDGTSRNRVARINTNGSLDGTFIPGTGANNTVRALAIQADGKIIIAGDFTSYNGTGRTRIARLNADGSLDGTFNPGAGANNSIRAMVIQPDGKIIIAGGFTTYDGTGRNRLARLNTDGTLDGTFAPTTGANNFVHALALQADGKVIIGGIFATYNGTARNRIARVNANGTLDGAFAVGTGFNNSVFALALQADGKVIVGGQYTSYNATARNRIARLLTTGAIDVSFNPGSGAGDIINAVCLQTNEKILIGGDFFSYNGTGRNRIARVMGDCTDSFNAISPSACGSVTVNSETYTESGTYTQFLMNAGGCDSILTINVSIPTPACYDPFALNYNPFAPCSGGPCFYEPTPVILTANAFPTCNLTSSATALPGASNLPGLGPNGGDPDDDIYFAFTVGCEGAVKVKVNGTGINAVLELYDASYNFISAVDADATVGGTEILLQDGLMSGTYVVRVYDHGTGSFGNFSICVTSLCSSRADAPYPSLTYDVCDVYKAQHRAAASGYQWEFFGTTNFNLLTYTQNTNYTFLTLASLTGGVVEYGETYDVTIGVIYNDVDLGPVTIYGVNTDPCVMNAAPTSQVATAYIGGTFQLNALIKSTISCNADGYVWRFTPVSEAPLVDHTVLGTTFLTLCDVTGILPGKTYNVEVAVIYDGFQYPFGTSQTVNTAAYTTVNLRTQDNCGTAGAVSLGYSIFTNSFRPCAKDYTWEFTPLPSGLPIYHKKGDGIRSVKLSTVSGLVPGSSYTVRVKAEYGNFTGLDGFTGEPLYDFSTAYGSSDTICLVGPASEQTEEQAETVASTVLPGIAMNVYPVPAGSELNIRALIGADVDQVHLAVYDLTGRVVWAEVFPSGQRELNIVINIETALSSGSYVLKMTAGTEEVTSRISVIR